MKLFQFAVVPIRMVGLSFVSPQEKVATLASAHRGCGDLTENGPHRLTCLNVWFRLVNCLGKIKKCCLTGGDVTGAWGQGSKL